jgi:hypothetical protein
LPELGKSEKRGKSHGRGGDGLKKEGAIEPGCGATEKIEFDLNFLQ